MRKGRGEHNRNKQQNVANVNNKYVCCVRCWHTWWQLNSWQIYRMQAVYHAIYCRTKPFLVRNVKTASKRNAVGFMNYVLCRNWNRLKRTRQANSVTLFEFVLVGCNGVAMSSSLHRVKWCDMHLLNMSNASFQMTISPNIICCQ